jgi:subtilisin-like proprotein convertase family protein
VRFTVTQPPDTIPPTVRVIAPNGGETLFPGNVFRIRWEASDNVGVAKVHIWLFQGNEQVMVIARDLPNTGYYDWTVPNRPGANYRIRIAAVDAAGNAGYDDSDGTFEIGGEVRVTAQIVSLTTDKNQYNPRETVRIRYTIRNTGDVRIELRMVVEIVDPSGRSVYDSHRVDQDRRHDLDPGQTASGEFTWTIPADAVPGTYEVRASLRHWNIWDKIFDYRWGDRPGPRFTVQAGVQGTLQHFDLDYHGTPPNSDGNDQTTVTVSPCSRLTLFFYYREGNAGNNYIIRVYAEWDKNNFIANSDNNEAGPESDGREIGGFRWDVETYTVPCTPGTYKVRVVYRASTTPPTWDSYDRLLAEGTVIVQEAATATLQVGIRHTYIGDLKIWVGVEGGREVLIWNREGGGTRDLFREWNLLQLGFTVNDLPPSESKRWYLRIRDEARGDEGRLEYFRIIYQGRTYESQDRPEIKDFQEVRAWIPSRGAPSLPDLTVRNVNFSPQSVSQGGSITVSWTEVNIGSGNAGPYRVGIYLGVSEYGRDHLLGSFNRDGLVAGGSRSYTQTFTIPSSVPPGSYYVTVFIDDLRVVSEANEDNNVGSSTPNRLSVGESVLLFLEINMPWAEGRGQTTARGEVIGGITLVGPREIRVGQTYEYKLYISVGQGPTTGINYYIYGTREKPGVATIFIPEELDWQFNPHRDFSYPGISWQSGTLDWLRRYIGWAIAEIITLMVEALKGSWAGLLASLGIFIIGALIPDSTQATYDVRFGEAIEAPNNDPARSDAITVTWIEQGNTQGPIVIIIHVTPSEYARGKEFKLGVAVDLWIGGWQRDLHYLITGNSYSIRVL